MGWSSGSGLMSDVIKSVKKHVPDEDARKAIYKPLIKSWEQEDCDTLYECKGMDPAFDAALPKKYFEFDEE